MIGDGPSLLHLASYVNGYPFKPDDLEGEGLQVIRIRQLLDPTADVDRTDLHVPDVAVADGDLVFSWSATLAIRIWNRGPALLNQHLFRVDPRPGVHRRWLRYVLEVARDRLVRLMHGSAMTHVTRDMLSTVRVPLPPAGTQRAIADYLDTETARIDALIAKRNEQSGLLDQRSRAIVSAAFGEVRWADGLPRLEATVPLVRLGRIAQVQTGLTLDSARRSDDEAEFPYLRVANVQDGYLDLGEVKTVHVSRALASRCMLRGGDVLMTEGGDPDKLGRGTVYRAEIGNCLHQNHVFAVRPGADLLPDYLAYVTAAPYARAYFEVTSSKTTGIASTSTSKISDFLVPLPGIGAQEAIVRGLDEALDAIRRAANLLEVQKARLSEHRRALVTAAVTGQIDVPGAPAA